MAKGVSKLVFLLPIFLSFVALLFTCIGYGTNHWQEMEVDRSQISITELYIADINEDLGRFYYTRHRGIFLECYPDDNVAFLNRPISEDDIVDDDCFRTDFDEPDGADVSDDYSRRLSLLCCVVACFAFSVALGLLAIVFGIVASVKMSRTWTLVAALMALLTGLIVTLGIAFFLGVDHMEREESGDARELIFRENWSQALDDATSTSWEWSFALAWVAAILAFIASALYFLIAWRLCHNADDSSSSSSSSSEASQPPKKSKLGDKTSRRSSSRKSGAHPYILNEAFQPTDNRLFHGGLPVLAMPAGTEYDNHYLVHPSLGGGYYYNPAPGGDMPQRASTKSEKVKAATFVA